MIFLDDFYEYEPLDYLSRKRYFVYNSNLNSNVSMELSETYCFHTNTTQQLLQLHYEDWYQIGTYNHLNTNNPKYNSSVFSKVNGELWFTLEVSNISADDLGDYYGVIGISVYDLTTWCREYRYSFIPFHWRYNYGIIPVAVIHSSLEIYSKCRSHMCSNYYEALLSNNFFFPQGHLCLQFYLVLRQHCLVKLFT